MAEYIVEFRNVTKRYPGQKALIDTSFKLPRGKLLAYLTHFIYRPG
ncbi:MAG: hypothetical protein H0Z40_06870 [Desulfotomaculum sp.]|nr:hypothetical protein [Desulfotomaculum sp.]